MLGAKPAGYHDWQIFLANGAQRVTHISYVGRYIGLVQSRINNMSWRTNGVNLVPRKHTNCQAFLTSIIKHNIRQITQ